MNKNADRAISNPDENAAEVPKGPPRTDPSHSLPDDSPDLPDTPVEPVPAAEIVELKTKADKAAQLQDQLLRLSADFDNFRKRAARERQEAVKFANESLLQKLIPVLDNFEMALAATQSAQQASVQSLQSGVQMIYQQLRNLLLESGLEEVAAENQAFDPNMHEAISQMETTDLPEGHVVQQLRKGYKLRDRLLRPASVVVAKKPAA